MLWGVHHTNSATSSSFDVTRHLSVGDVLFYPNRIHPISMTARFKYSKMDPFGRVHVITLYSTGSFTCPVKTMQRYVSSRSWLANQPLFITREGKSLTRIFFLFAQVNQEPLVYSLSADKLSK